VLKLPQVDQKRDNFFGVSYKFSVLYIFVRVVICNFYFFNSADYSKCVKNRFLLSDGDGSSASPCAEMHKAKY